MVASRRHRREPRILRDTFGLRLRRVAGGEPATTPPLGRHQPPILSLSGVNCKNGYDTENALSCQRADDFGNFNVLDTVFHHDVTRSFADEGKPQCVTDLT